MGPQGPAGPQGPQGIPGPSGSGITNPAILTFLGEPDGPYNGLHQNGVDFGQGNWTIIGGQLAPAVGSTAIRSIAFTRNVTIGTVTFSVASTRAAGLVVYNGLGQSTPAFAVGVAQDTQFNPGMPASAKITVSANSGGDPTAIRIRSVMYQ